MTLFRNFFSCVRGNRSHRHRQIRTSGQTKIKLGVPLSKLCNDSHLPLPLLKLVTFLAREGAQANDLFRRPGNMIQVMSIIKLLSQGKTVQWSSYNLYTVANVAKKVLLSIPGGLFGRRGEEKLLATLDSPEEERIEEFLCLIRQMDNANREFTIILFGILFRMVAHAAAASASGTTRINSPPIPSPTQISIESFGSSASSAAIVHSILSEAVAKSVAGSLFHTCRDSPDKIEHAVPILQTLILSFPSFDVEFIDYFDQMVNKLSLSNSSTGSSRELSHTGSMKIVRKPSQIAASLEAWTESFGKGPQQQVVTSTGTVTTTTAAAVVAAALVASVNSNNGSGNNGNNGNGNKSRRGSLSRRNTLKNRPSPSYYNQYLQYAAPNSTDPRTVDSGPLNTQYSYQLSSSPYELGLIPAITITNPYGDIEFGFHPPDHFHTEILSNQNYVLSTNNGSNSNNNTNKSSVRHPIDRLQSMKRRHQANQQRRSAWFLSNPVCPTIPSSPHTYTEASSLSNDMNPSFQYTAVSTSDIPSATMTYHNDYHGDRPTNGGRRRGISDSPQTSPYLITSDDAAIVTTASYETVANINNDNTNNVVMVTCGGSSICLGQLDPIICTSDIHGDYADDNLGYYGDISTTNRCCCVTVANTGVRLGTSDLSMGYPGYTTTEMDINSVCRCRPTVAVASICCTTEIVSHPLYHHHYHHGDEDDEEDDIQEGDIVEYDDGISYLLLDPSATTTSPITSPTADITTATTTPFEAGIPIYTTEIGHVISSRPIASSYMPLDNPEAPSSVPLMRRMLPTRMSLRERVLPASRSPEMPIRTSIQTLGPLQPRSAELSTTTTNQGTTTTVLYEDGSVLLHINDDDEDDDEDDLIDEEVDDGNGVIEEVEEEDYEDEEDEEDEDIDDDTQSNIY